MNKTKPIKMTVKTHHRRIEETARKTQSRLKAAETHGVTAHGVTAHGFIRQLLNM